MLYLTEDDVGQLLTTKDALREVEAALRDLGDGKAENRPRQRVHGEHALLNFMAASWPARGYYGFKYYSISREYVRFWFHLFDARSGEPLAVLQANRLGQQRTGAASGIATKSLARTEATTVAILGTGWQAESQLEAICQVRGISRIRCHSRQRPQRTAFADRMAKALGLDVEAAESAEAAVRGADIVVTATTSKQPVVQGDWLEPGTHINAMGGNHIEARELDDAVIQRAHLIIADSIEQARMEAGDLVQPVSLGLLRWDQVRELSEVAAGKIKGRENANDITLFKSLGLAIEDVAVGSFVYERARKEGVGAEISL